MQKNYQLLLAVLLFLIVGVIIVNSKSKEIDPVKLASESKSSCETKNKETCYARRLSTIAENHGSQIAFDTLFALQEIDSDAIGCHLMSHGIGEGVYKRSPADWQKSIKTINPSCSYGAVHGVMEEYVASLPNADITFDTVPLLCGTAPRADCNHIVGHLLLVETVIDIDKALEFCRYLKDDQQKYYCFSGVFMEYQTAINLVEHSYAPKAWLNWPTRLDELEVVCRSYEGREGNACWKEISRVALAKFRYDSKSAFDFCETANVEEEKIVCKLHTVSLVAARHRYDFEKAKPICTIPQPQAGFEKDCYARIVASALGTNPNLLAEAQVYCAGIPLSYQSACFWQIEGVKSWLHHDQMMIDASGVVDK